MPAKLPSGFYMGLRVKFDLQSIRDFQGWDICKVGPWCAIRAAWGGFPGGIPMALSLQSLAGSPFSVLHKVLPTSHGRSGQDL